jgi:hypothetical protein
MDISVSGLEPDWKPEGADEVHKCRWFCMEELVLDPSQCVLQSYKTFLKGDVLEMTEQLS